MTTIGDAYGAVNGCKILANTKPLIRSANFLRNLGATGRMRCAIGVAPPTSISQIAPRAAGGNAFSFPFNRWRLFQIN